MALPLQLKDRLVVNLNRLHPRARRYLLYKYIPWLFGGLGVVGMVYLTSIEDVFLSSPINLSGTWGPAEILFALSVAAILLAGVPIIYVWYRAFRYEIRLGHLHIRRGVFLKQENSLPLPLITDIRLEIPLRLFVFGLCSVHVETATAHAQQSVTIEGLSPKTALALRERLFRAILASRGGIDLNQDVALLAANVEAPLRYNARR